MNSNTMTDLVWDDSAECSRCGQLLRSHLIGVCADGRQPADVSPYVAPQRQQKGPFADHPITIGEARAERQISAAAWAPRDMLIQLLREIDNGLDVGAMVVTFSINHADGALGHGYRNACPDSFTALGLLARASHRLQE